MIPNLITKAIQFTFGLTIFTVLKNRFRKLHRFLQRIIEIILALVPSGLISILIYVKYISSLERVATLPNLVIYIVVALIAMFGIIIFWVLWYMVHRFLIISPVTAIGKGAKKTGKVIAGAGKKAGEGLSKTAKFTGEILSKAGGGRKRIFPGQAKHVEGVSTSAKEFMEKHHLVTQLLSTEQCCVVQGRRESKKWKKIMRKTFGMEVAATVRIMPVGNNLEITIGAGKWLDKAIGAAVAWYIFCPALLTTIRGIYIQRKLFVKIEKEIEEFLFSKS